MVVDPFIEIGDVFIVRFKNRQYKCDKQNRNMFVTFEAAEARIRLARKNRIRRERKTRLYTISVTLKTLGGRLPDIKIDSRKLFKDLHEIVKKKLVDQTKLFRLLHGGRELFDKNNVYVGKRLIETLTIADYFGITEPRLYELAEERAKKKDTETLTLLIIYT